MLRILGLHASKWNLVMLCGDIGVFLLALALVMYFGPQPLLTLEVLLLYQYGSVLLLLATNLVILYVADLYNHYHDFRQTETISRILFTVWVAMMVGGLLFLLFPDLKLSRGLLEWQAVAFGLLLVLWRYAFSALILASGLKRRVLVLGAGKAGTKIVETMRARPQSALEPVGFIDDDARKVGTEVAGLPVLGDSGRLEQFIDATRAEIVVMAITQEKSYNLLQALNRLSFNHCQLIDMPSFYEFLTGKIPLDYTNDIWLFSHNIRNSKVYYRHFKRLVDVVLASLGLLLTWPLQLLIAGAIKLDSRGPAFFRQERSGQNGKPFTIIKFRTMIKDAESNGPQFTAEHDPRITRVGWWLRKARLDELPQLFNILKGEMSFIGPRPERPNFIREFQEILPEEAPGRRAGDPPGTMIVRGYREKVPFYSYRMLVKPGVTGWAQVMYGYAASLAETKEKMQYDLYYIKNMSFFLDLSILLKTIRIVLFGRGT